MIVDTSILVAILKQEADADALSAKMLAHPGKLQMSAANYVEAAIVVDGNDDPALSADLDWLIDRFDIAITPVSLSHARSARQAYRRFGRGHHPARLNFGDCFAYALAVEEDQVLLFKGDDFSHTDVRRA